MNLARPIDAGSKRALTQHCRRVRALSIELGRRLGLSADDRRILGDAALIHHHPPELLNPVTVAATLNVALRQSDTQLTPAQANERRRDTEKLFKLLKAFHSLSLNRGDDPLAAVLGAANFWVEHLEQPPAEGDPRELALEAVRRKVAEGQLGKVGYRALTELPRPSAASLRDSIRELPVNPALALKALAMIAGNDAGCSELSQLVAQDPVLAGQVVLVANSALFSPSGRISSISHAISYIGLEHSRRIVTAASMRPLYGSAGMAELWKHSLKAAVWCESQSCRADDVRPDDAFLAGLVHDIGRLLVLKYGGDAGVAYNELLKQGCDTLFAETCVYGATHAEIGAAILTGWNFPEQVATGVRYHHRPEMTSNVIASLLYLVERQDPNDTCGYSPLSEQHAIAQTNIGADEIGGWEPEFGILEALAA